MLFFPATAANRPYSEKINTCVFPYQRTMYFCKYAKSKEKVLFYPYSSLFLEYKLKIQSIRVSNGLCFLTVSSHLNLNCLAIFGPFLTCKWAFIVQIGLMIFWRNWYFPNSLYFRGRKNSKSPRLGMKNERYNIQCHFNLDLDTIGRFIQEN